MNILGLSISRTKALNLAPADNRSAWYRIFESFTGAWQSNVEVETANVLTYAAVYACVTLIASDIGKLRIKLVEQDRNRIWNETESPSFSPVLRKPNRHQTRIKFLENWITSKLIYGNAYILKQRDNRGVVVALYVLDPQRVQALVAPNGDVYYEVQRDDLSDQPQERIIVPAREIIHDVNVALYHPLVGVSPITACGLAAVQGLRIQDNSAVFFGNGSQPGGFLTAPGNIPQTTADRLKAYFDTNFAGANRGKVAVGGDGLKYEPLGLTALDSQLIEQLKWTAENVCTAFRVPAYMIGVGPAPAYNNVEALSMQYYTQCLQTHIESIELLLDEGLGLTEVDRAYGTELDLGNLLRMDTATRIKASVDALAGGLSPNEVRWLFHDLGPVTGGESPMIQQQNYSLAALAKRDAKADPFDTASERPALPAPATEDDDDIDDDEAEKQLLDLCRREMTMVAA